MAKRRRITMTRFLKAGFKIASDGQSLVYEPKKAQLKLIISKDGCFIIPYMEGYRKKLEDGVFETADAIFDKIEEIKQTYEQEEIIVKIKDNVFD